MSRTLLKPAPVRSGVHPFQRFMIVAIGLCVFGPYLAGGIRTEQLAVYGFAASVLPFTITRVRVRGGMVLMAPWVFGVLIALIGVVFPNRMHTQWDAGSPISGMDNLLLPLMVMLLIWSAVAVESAPSLLRSFGRIVVWLTAANGALAAISTQVDTAPLLGMFWGDASADTPTTAFNAATMGRFSGIFNQPAEAGVMHAVAGLLAIYLYGRKPGKLALLLTLIVAGGLVSVSKVFILGGIPLIVIYLWRSRSVAGKAGFVASALIIAGAVAQTGWLQAWTGFTYLTRLLAPAENQSLIEFYTAGRWNEDSKLASVIDEIMRVSPISGVGAGGLKVPYDSGWTETIVFSGILGAVAHAVVLLGVFVIAKGTVDPSRRTLTFFLALLLVGADLGIPAFTANRVATVVWVVLALLVLAMKLPAEPVEPPK